ncbi:ATP-binding protein [Pseudonocardia sp. TRM90224]|uniref:ATP-binding protein n=1 Tax=Pseudonocardia sp. TRM90224 TaxID=2812678 RepID=UPI001E521C97|nr:ATP-binding protein [Pseudonocardia sp. TRM90224]
MVTADNRAARWDLAVSPSAPSIARRHLTTQLRTWQIAHVDDVETAALITNELVTNAVEHSPKGATVIGFALSFDGAALTIEVRDSSHSPPQLQPLNPLASRGRGLQMIDALTSHWHYELYDTGKTVRAVLPTSTEATPP